jgi:hypothetical protein
VVSTSAPEPPYSSGIGRPARPKPATCFQTSQSQPARSRSTTPGSTCSLAKSRTERDEGFLLLGQARIHGASPRREGRRPPTGRRPGACHRRNGTARRESFRSLTPGLRRSGDVEVRPCDARPGHAPVTRQAGPRRARGAGRRGAARRWCAPGSARRRDHEQRRHAHHPVLVGQPEVIRGVGVHPRKPSRSSSMSPSTCFTCRTASTSATRAAPPPRPRRTGPGRQRRGGGRRAGRPPRTGPGRRGGGTATRRPARRQQTGDEQQTEQDRIHQATPPSRTSCEPWRRASPRSAPGRARSRWPTR